VKKNTYKSSGVDIRKANSFIGAIEKSVKSTLSSEVVLRKGSFGALFAIDKLKFKNPILVSSTDGVGTKLLVAKALGIHDTIGIDLVAMNVNDILCVGAKPLFFLDYIACGKLNVNILSQVVEGITAGCRLSGCSLIGGETAEMPGMYKREDYDLAGFAVGIVEKNKIIDGASIKEGDQVLGLPSSGLHSNGFSFVRKILSLKKQKKFGLELLCPTRIYAKEVFLLQENFKLKGIAHITGGAFYDKLTKVLPEGKCFAIKKDSWPVLDIFRILQQEGNVSDKEMYKTFNMGIGLALVIQKRDVLKVRSFLEKKKIEFYHIGEVISNKKKKVVFV